MFNLTIIYYILATSATPENHNCSIAGASKTTQKVDTERISETPAAFTAGHQQHKDGTENDHVNYPRPHRAFFRLVFLIVPHTFAFKDITTKKRFSQSLRQVANATGGNA